MIPDKIDIKITKSENFKSTTTSIASGCIDIKKILRSKIYSNKIQSVIREALTNAIDAHVENNCKDRPVEITLPSFFEPTFKVRDYGKGLSDEEIRNIYFSYGDPTGTNIKKTNNNEHGMYHIGAKSPLCYTNVFQVTAIKDGIKRIYTTYIGQDEDDYVDKIGENETDEPSGLEVSIPVKQEDIQSFVKESGFLFRYIEPTPIVKGNPDYKHVETEYIIRGDKWAFIQNDSYYKSSYVVMGGVPYKLSQSSIPDLSYGTPKHNILQQAVILYANIGDINVNAGREELEYTEKTIKFVMDRLELIETEAKKQVEDQINKAKSEYEVRKLYYDYFSHYGSMGSILTQILKSSSYKLLYNGKAIDEYLFDIKDKAVDAYSCYATHTYRGGYKNTLRTNAESHVDIFGKLNCQKNKNITNLKKFFYYIETDPNGVSKELSRGKVVNLLGYYLKESFSHPILDSQVLVLSFETQQKYEDWAKDVGIPDGMFVNISTYIVIPPKPPKVRVPRQSNGMTRKYPADIMLKDNYKRWKEEEIDIKTESGYYVTRFYSNRYLKYESCVDSSSSKNDENLLDRALTFLQDRALLPDKIYAFTPKYVEKLDKSKWIPLENLVKTELEKYNKTNNVDVIPVSMLGLSSGESKFFQWIQTGKFEVDDDNPVKVILKNIADKKVEFTNYRDLNSYFEFKIEEYDDKIIDNYKRIIEGEYKKYSLLNCGYHFSSYSDYDKDYLLYLNAKYKQLKEKELEKKKKAEESLVTA